MGDEEMQDWSAHLLILILCSKPFPIAPLQFNEAVLEKGREVKRESVDNLQQSSWKRLSEVSLSLQRG